MKSNTWSAVVLLLSGGLSCAVPVQSSKQNAYHYTIDKQITAAKVAVVCAHPLASSIGVDIMKKGGNAFDAAIATQLALAVVYPSAGNIGGGGFMVARLANGKTVSLDFRETAPAGAHKAMYLDSAGNVIPNKSVRGPGSAGVPGSVAGLFETIKFARLPFAQLIDPAIALAEQGFVITENEANSLNQLQDEFTRFNRVATPFHRQTPWKKSDTLFQPELANTLKLIREKGAAGFYTGQTADLIASQMNDGGYITKNDLLAYRAKWREPHQFNYRNLQIVTMGLPSSGGVLLHQMLGMFESTYVKGLTHLSADAVQLMAEIERRAYADRAEYLGDADFVSVPVAKLTDRKYLLSRMRDFVPGVAGSSRATKPGLEITHESEETTHISIIDGDGNAVSVTTTLNDSYGSKTFVAGAGFLLNNEMDDFSIKPGQPNLYGAVGGEANAISPGKRMLSSMSPTIVLKDSLPFLVVGTPGGTTIPTSVFQTIVNVVDFNLGTADAVNSPKFHHQWLPDQLYIEKMFPDTTRMLLTQMGYSISERASIGRTEVIRMNNNGTIEAVADVRGDDDAEGF